MENKEITKQLKLTSSLMDLHGENSFKATSYSIAAFRLEKIPESLANMPVEELEKLEGVGKSLVSSIQQIIETGSFPQLDDLLERTPKGVMDMLDISGVGPKKIEALWRELGVESLDELWEAARSGEVAKVRGFGKKVEENIIEGIKYLKKNSGFLRIDQVLEPVNALVNQLKNSLPNARIEIVGDLRRSMDVMEMAELLISSENLQDVRRVLQELAEDLSQDQQASGPFVWRGNLKEPGMGLTIWLCHPDELGNELIRHTGSMRHLTEGFQQGRLLDVIEERKFGSEEEVYAAVGMPYVIPELREGLFESEIYSKSKEHDFVSDSDLVGILHNHSNYSDGRNTLREMAEGCRDLGMQYLGITDHSKTAVYANGLDEDRVREQHLEIDQLNQEMAPFRIFKGIESDILEKGQLDYAPEVLETFDFIVASIHAQMNMTREKATERLVAAIENPFTTMLGHPTGRLVLRRDGYPIDHKKVIDACARNQVIIEINANPHRLDLEWQWVKYATDQGVLISINPDAHAVGHYKLMYYGIGSGRKGGLTREMTFNAWPVDQVADYFERRRQKAISTAKA